MKITLESYEAQSSWNPIKMYSYPEYVATYRRYPILEQRTEDVSRSTFLLGGLEDVFKYPESVVKEIDTPLVDGVIHAGKVFKPTEFKLNIYFNTSEFMNVIGPIYLSRGVVKCTLITDWGTTNVFPVVVTELDEMKTNITLKNPNILVDQTQNSKYEYFINNEIVEVNPAPNLFPNGLLYPHILYQTDYQNINYIYVADTETCQLEFNFKLEQQPWTLTNIIINGTPWSLPEIEMEDRGLIYINWEVKKIQVRRNLSVPAEWYPIDSVGKIATTSKIEIVGKKGPQYDVSYTNTVDLTVKSKSSQAVIS